MSTETVGPDVPEPVVPPQPDTAPAVPAQAPEPAAETLPAAEPATGDEILAVEGTAVEGAPAEDEPKPARRLSTGRLLLAAALLGPVVGAGVGYAVQASRPATPLPELAAVKLAYPADRVDPKALAAAAPQPLNIDGDLRDLLLKRPDGTEEWGSAGARGGWLDAADYAESFGDSRATFTRLLDNGFRRAATVGWKSGGTEYRIRLIQYRSDSASSATSWNDYGSTTDAEVGKIPGNPQSRLVIGNKPNHYAQSTEEYYRGEATARKGDLIMEITVFAPSRVDRAQLEDIAKRQWERIA
ncbi:hypothetical protein ACGFX4_08650 [Kitasatospora sp. NPDC048365]|uniref:hypothetical protein n=1 Tax=Kitasatospora sp. NPDC048365 TaxID=3364050 RepID=UPI0037146C56